MKKSMILNSGFASSFFVTMAPVLAAEPDLVKLWVVNDTEGEVLIST